jgi:DNA-binding transcriptional LysR family regulator
VNPRRIDLNLLVALEALVSEGSVSGAARRLHLTQPAVSHALARLRESFGDPVLERAGRAMRPTARARAALPEVRALLAQSRRLFAGAAGFEPANAQRTFHVGASDYAAARVLPVLTRVLRRDAPGVRLVAHHAGRADAPARVVAGALELALGVFPSLTPDLAATTLWEEPYACAITGGARRHALNRAEYLAAAHVNIMVQGETLGLIDEALARRGIERRVVLVVPHFAVARSLVEGTDLVLTAPAGLLDGSPASKALLRFAPPLELPPFRTQMLHSRRRDHDPGLAWLRGLVEGAARSSALAAPAKMR